jgi:hypothetical protein
VLYRLSYASEKLAPLEFTPTARASEKWSG